LRVQPVLRGKEITVVQAVQMALLSTQAVVVEEPVLLAVAIAAPTQATAARVQRLR
jgi:hypothetical protein